jgi:hypothetical protein
MAPLSAPDVLQVDSNHGMSSDVFNYETFAGPLNAQLDKLAASSRRRVRFAREQEIVMNPEKEYYTDEDIQIKWWSMEGLGEVRQRAKQLSTLLRHHAKSHDCELTMAHRKTTLILASDFHSLVKLSLTSPVQDLSTWCSRDDGSRGLERFSSKVYCSFRRRDVTNTRAAVLEEQSRQRSQQIYDPELIAEKAREVSRRARNFALFFGGADAKQVSDAKQVLKRDGPPPVRQIPPRKRSRMCAAA